MLTARHEAESRIEGLEIGADDYVAKPFEPRELSLRISNILKRTRRRRWRRVGAGRVRGLTSITWSAANCGKVRRPIASPTASATCCDSGLAAPGETVPRNALTGDGSGERTRGRRADQPPAAQDRARSRQSLVPAGGARHRLSLGRIAMSTPRPSNTSAPPSRIPTPEGDGRYPKFRTNRAPEKTTEE